MYKKIAGGLMAALAAASLGLMTAPAANAVTYLDQGDLSIACRLAHGNNAWTAHLQYPSQGGFGWRCWQDFGTGRSGVNIEGFCQYYYGNHARGGSTAYNWYCGA